MFASRLPALLLFCLSCATAQAAPHSPPPPVLCESAITAAEDSLRLPPHLLLAIAQVETGRPDQATGQLRPWPWTINADGAGAFFATKAQAIAAVQALQAQGVQSIDIGCTQINLMYHPAAFASLSQAFDPRANALYAAHFLNALHTESRDWPTAVGDYHSQTAVLGADYRKRVLALWHDPSADWHLGLAVAYRDFAPRAASYSDFAASTTAYGAFATEPSGAPAAPRTAEPHRPVSSAHIALQAQH
jgi:hypothetical protein